MSAICALTGPADDGTPDGIGVKFATQSFDNQIDVDAWDDEGNLVALVIDRAEAVELRDALSDWLAADAPQSADRP